MGQGSQVDYDALAKQFGAVSSQPAVDYDALAKAHGAISSKPGVVPKEQLDRIRALNASPTQFEYERNPDNQAGAAGAIGEAAPALAKGVAKQLAITGSGPIGAAYQVYEEGKQAAANISDIRSTGKTEQTREDEQRKAAGRSLAYRAVAPLGSAVGLNVPAMEHAADIGDAGAVVGQAAVPAAAALAAPLAEGLVRGGSALKGMADFEAKQAATMRKVVPEAANLPDKAIAGAEDVFRAAAPTGKNPGFRANLYAAAPDLADVARKVDISEAKGGILTADGRVRATVEALNSHLKDMYQNERVPQIQAHADVPVKVGLSQDAVTGLEHIERISAGQSEIQSIATKALETGGLTLAEADKLAISANKSLKAFEKAPSDIQEQMLQTSPKVGGLKSLDVELGKTINDTLADNGEVGIRDYERRFAAVSEVRNQIRDRMNAVELERKNIGKYVKVITGGKEAIASASQAAVSSVNIGRKLQSGFSKLADSGITAGGPPEIAGPRQVREPLGLPSGPTITPPPADATKFGGKINIPIDPTTRAERLGLLLPESTAVEVGPSSLEGTNQVVSRRAVSRVVRDPRTGKMVRQYVTGNR